MLLVDEAPSFPSLLLVFSLCLGPLISEMIYMSSANYNYPFLSVMLFFCTILLCFIPLTSALSHQRTKLMMVQITAAFVGTYNNTIQLLPAVLGFSKGSCG